MSILKNFIVAVLVIFSQLAIAQLKTPQPSPAGSVTQLVGLTDVTVKYSRPGMKDRNVFGELVEFDKIWRTGANKATSITFSTEVIFGGTKVAAGSYSLFTIPGKNAWTIILNKNTEHWGTGTYDEKDDAARITVTPKSLTDAVETLTFDFSDLEGANGQLNLSWEKTKVSVLIETNANDAVEKQIKEILIDGPDAGTYSNAARYYLENNKDLKQALAWINLAIEKRPTAFWYMHQKAKIQAKLGDTKGAIASAEASLKMAKENKDGDFGYVANNEALLKELKGK